MKKLLMLLVLMPLMTLADTEVVDGIEWTYEVYEGKATIGGWGDAAIPSSTTGVVTIPPTLGGCPVTSIGGFAFADCYELTSVTIPSTVASIGDGALACENLKTVLFLGNAPVVAMDIDIDEEGDGCDSIFHKDGDVAPNDLCVYVPKNSVGWAGTFSTALPAYWQDRKIVHSEDMVDWSDFLSTIGVGQESDGGAGYPLSGNVTGNAKVSSMTVSADVTISSFELVNGKVMDMAIRIVNTASSDIRLRLPTGYTYETIGNGNPLIIPANSTSMVTITQTTDTTFLVSRQKLSVIQQ